VRAEGLEPPRPFSHEDLNLARLPKVPPRPLGLSQSMPHSTVRRDKHHEDFLRGLIHSDGCRIVANDRGVKSLRYHFSNKSEDIKDLYCRSLDALGVGWTRPCGRQIAVYRKASVAILDQFIGPQR
jgi:hypothetical protein